MLEALVDGLLGLATNKTEEVQFASGDALAFAFGNVSVGPDEVLRSGFESLAVSSRFFTGSDDTEMVDVAEPVEPVAVSPARETIQTTIVTKIMDEFVYHSRVEVTRMHEWPLLPRLPLQHHCPCSCQSKQSPLLLPFLTRSVSKTRHAFLPICLLLLKPAAVLCRSAGPLRGVHLAAFARVVHAAPPEAHGDAPRDPGTTAVMPISSPSAQHLLTESLPGALNPSQKGALAP